MSSDSESEDDLLFEICRFVTSDMDSVLLKYPELLDDINKPTKRNVDKALEITEDSPEFQKQFQISRLCFADLMSKIASVSKITNLKKKLLFTLWMLSCHDSYHEVGQRFNFSKSSGHAAFNEILDAILALFADYVKWPAQNEFQEISKSFKEKTDNIIPGIIGIIDACHFQIKQPRDNPERYINDKEFHSIVLQAVCDHRKIFTDVYVGSPGSLSDSVVLSESNLYKQIDSLIPGEYHLIGDTNYPLIRNLITPFRDNGHLSTEKSRFNNHLYKARETIEEALLILFNRFKKLSNLNISNPEMVNKIICTCITIHNHIRMFDIDEAEDKLVMADVSLQLGKINNHESIEQWNPRPERKKAGVK